jgi:hypothetical protein
MRMGIIGLRFLKKSNDYPVTLYYSNTAGETKTFELKTDGMVIIAFA